MRSCSGRVTHAQKSLGSINFRLTCEPLRGCCTSNSSPTLLREGICAEAGVADDNFGLKDYYSDEFTVAMVLAAASKLGVEASA